MIQKELEVEVTEAFKKINLVGKKGKLSELGLHKRVNRNGIRRQGVQHVSLKRGLQVRGTRVPRLASSILYHLSGYLAAGKAHGKWFVLRKVI